MKKIEIHSGMKFNKLTIIKELECQYTTGGNKKRIIEAICDCGNIKSYNLKSLTTKTTKSCGCWNLEVSRNRFKTHGHSGTRIHNIWKDMKKRCKNDKCINYKNYGGRGISVCEDWISNFESFYKWSIENNYSNELTIDRIDINGNYEPSNCRWITSQEQKYNTRNQRLFKGINPEGESFEGKCIKLFAEEHNLKASMVSDCLNKRQHTHRNWRFERLE